MDKLSWIYKPIKDRKVQNSRFQIILKEKQESERVSNLFELFLESPVVVPGRGARVADALAVRLRGAGRGGGGRWRAGPRRGQVPLPGPEGRV